MVNGAQPLEPAVARSPYRPDIQGLRGIAVLLVVVYHTGSGWLSGGYVGVDVFFVISGYLITNHLLAGLTKTSRIDFGQFYARRIRRILPASFVVLILTSLATLVFASPIIRRTALKDAFWTALYVPNIRFALQGRDYLAETYPSPFQHYWSLGVEEQFYLLWPLLLLLLWHLTRVRRAPNRRWVLVGLALLVLASFGASWWLTYADRPWAFFGLPTRTWQLGVGALIAVLGSQPVTRLPGWFRSLLSWLGVLLILVSAFRLSEDSVFPGWVAAPPVLGAGLVIASLQAPAPWAADRVLGQRWLVFLGTISYSLYLVHWPLQVIPAAASGRLIADGPAWWLAALALPLAWLLHRTVEEPLRNPQRLRRQRPRAQVGAAVGGALVVALGLYVVVRVAPLPVMDAGRPYVGTAKLGSSLPPQFAAYVPGNLIPTLADAYKDIPATYANDCTRPVESARPEPCSFGDLTSGTVVALYGDSHATSWFTALAQLASDH